MSNVGIRKGRNVNLFKKNWIVYAITDNQIRNTEGHKIIVDKATKRQAINKMYDHLNHYSFRNIVKIVAIRKKF